jgi:hypothetical protein
MTQHAQTAYLPPGRRPAPGGLTVKVFKRWCYVLTADKKHRVVWNGECFCIGFRHDDGWFYQGLHLSMRPAKDQPLLRPALATLVRHLRRTGVHLDHLDLRVNAGVDRRRAPVAIGG